MTRLLRSITLPIIALLLAAGCSESSREQATGDSPILALNAIVESPDVTFLIEARSLGTISYGNLTPLDRWDDLSYNFHFDISVPGESSARRLASEFLDVERDRNYLFVLAGTIANPEVMLFDEEETKWDGSEDVFELAFLHVNNTLGPVDVYFHAPGTNPVAGNQAATIDYGERAAPQEFAAGEFVVTVTPANDDQTILFTSLERTFTGATTNSIALLDADPGRTSPFVLRHLTAAGASTELADSRFQPTVVFHHAVAGAGNLDISESGNTLVSNQAFGERSGDVAVPAGAVDYTWTDAGNPGAIVNEASQSVTAGFRRALTLVGEASDPTVLNTPVVRRPYATSGRLAVMNAASNHDTLDLYLVTAGTDIADASPAWPNTPFPTAINMLPVATDSYEMYATVNGEKTVLAGPLAIDIGPRDLIEVIVLDDPADPNTVDFQVYR